MMGRRGRFEIWRRRIQAIDENPVEGETKWLKLSPKWFALVQSLIGEMEHPSHWTGTKEQVRQAIRWVLDIEAQTLTPPEEPPPEEPPANGTDNGTPPPRDGFYPADLSEILTDLIDEFGYEELLEELDMPCNCPEFKWINGVLHESYKDDCGCKKWRPVPSEGTGTGGLNGSQGANLGGALLDENGKAKPGSKLDLAPVELDQRNFEITACSKATALVDIVLTTIEGLLEGKTQWDNLGDAVGLPLGTWAEAMAGFFTTTIPAAAPAAMPLALAKLARELTQPVRDELIDKLNEPQLRERLICEQAKTMVRDADVFGEDLESVLDSFTLGVAAYSAVSIALHMWDLEQISDVLRLAVNDNDCGCPELVQQMTPQENTRPELATWGVEADLKIHDDVYYSLTIDAGTWVSGEGIEQSIDGDKTRSWVWIALTGLNEIFIERVDIFNEDVVFGSFWSAVNGADYDLEGKYTRWQTNNQEWQVQTNKAGWNLRTIGKKVNLLRVQSWFAYDERDPSTIPDTTGRGTITKVRVWGRGTIPANFAAWEVIYQA